MSRAATLVPPARSALWTLMALLAPFLAPFLAPLVVPLRAHAAVGAPSAFALAPFSRALDSMPSSWQLVTLPRSERHTRFTIVASDTGPVLQVSGDRSYGGLVHAVVPPWTAATHLRWRWRVDRAPQDVDLRRRNGDDAALRICVLYDVPLERLSIGDRLLMRAARALYRQDLPAATLCYLWAPGGRDGEWIENASASRVRMRAFHGGDAELGLWFVEERDLHADFIAAFPREAQGGVPPIRAVSVSADTDNTGSSSLALVGDVVLARL